MSYAEPVRELVHRLKFKGNRAVGPVLGGVLAERLASSRGARPDILLPVPLHKARLRERGFNQAVEIARVVARSRGVPLALHGAGRVRRTEPQSQLQGVQARRANLRGAFRVDGGVRGLHVVIVDDVVTTGATVGELSRELLRAGAQRVDVWACCRAAPPGDRS
jgi:ComF family protein